MAKLYFRYSAMNAGKSIALLQVAHNYEEQGMNVVLFTSDLDNRFGHANIASRLGVARKALVFTRWTNFYERLKDRKELFLDDNQVVEEGMREYLATTVKPVACVLIDEAQFLDPEQVRQLHKLAHVADLPVICYGIRSDFLGEPFPGAAYLLTLADDIEELKNICACGRKATMNVRIDDRGERITEGEQVAIEGTVRYIQTCGRCFYGT
ncbi:MAG: thymidine kinase [Candidatus Lustribacter sp.]